MLSYLKFQDSSMRKMSKIRRKSMLKNLSIFSRIYKNTKETDRQSKYKEKSSV